MFYDLQKANLLKRLSAWIFDTIVLMVLVTGLALLLSTALGYDNYSNQLTECYEKYEEEYNVKFHITQEEYDKMTPDAQERYDQASAALNEDKDAMHAFNMMFSLILVILSLSILGAYMVLEVLIPVKLGNGQTLGKKIFGLALMRTNGVKINNICLCIRTVLGKFTIETMIPVLLLIMIFFGVIGFLAPAIIGILLVVQAALLIITSTNAAIHDVIADTVVVDMASQMIFNSELELMDYKKKIAAEKAAKKPY